MTNDYPTIMAVTILYSTMLVVVILIVDLLYGLIDPRIRVSGGAKRLMETVNKIIYHKRLKIFRQMVSASKHFNSKRKRAYCHTVFKFLTRLMASFEKE